MPPWQRSWGGIEPIHKSSFSCLGEPEPYAITDRRPGDIAACYAHPKKADRKLEWKAEHSLDDIMADAWRWQSDNPNGYQ